MEEDQHLPRNRFDFVATAKHWQAAGESPHWFRYILTWDATLERFRESRESILFQLDPQPDWTLVDLGCGAGRIAKWAAPAVKEYIGVDVAASMIERAREYCRAIDNATFLVSDTLRALRPGIADCVLCERVFIHLTREQQARYVAEAWDVLRPGGLFAVQVPAVAAYVNGWTREEVVEMFGRWVMQISGEAAYLVRAVRSAE